MSDYHHFSRQLHGLLQRADLKHQVVADALQYDVSYVSKWVNGKALPAERQIEGIADALSDLIISSSQCDTVKQLLQEYDCADRSELKQSLQESFLEAYESDKGIARRQNSPPEYHVSLSTDWLAGKIQEEGGNERLGVFDLFAMDHSARLKASGILNGNFVSLEKNPDIHFSVGFNPVSKRENFVYDVISLIHMLTSYSGIDFNLYALPFSAGKYVYAVKGKYSVSGMLFKEGECLNVTECRNAADVDALYQRMSLLMTSDQLVFRKTTMQSMMRDQFYARLLVAGNARWLLGHVTEHLLPDSIFEELIKKKTGDEGSMLLRLYTMEGMVLKNKATRVMLYDSALAAVAGTGEIDFFNSKVILNEEQRCLFFSYLSRLAEADEIHFEIICEGFSADFRHITNPCVFLSDAFCCLRLENGRYEDNLLVLQNREVRDLFDEFFEIIWSGRRDVVIEDKEAVLLRIKQYAGSIVL